MPPCAAAPHHGVGAGLDPAGRPLTPPRRPAFDQRMVAEPARHEHSRKHKVLVGRHAAAFDRASGIALRWLYRSVAQQVSAELPPAGTVLDVGSGPGHLLVELARRRPDIHLVGIDPSEDMVGHAMKRAAEADLSDRVDARVASAEKLPFRDGSFDAVVSTLSAHHWSDVAAAVSEQARVLRPGGIVWIFDLRRGPAQEAAQRLEHDSSLTIEPARLSRIASLLLVGYRARRI